MLHFPHLPLQAIKCIFRSRHTLGRHTCTHKIFNYHVSYFILYTLYKEEYSDGTHSSVKWSCPNIHDLKNILDKVNLDNILESVCDKRLSSLSDLPLIQLKDECDKLKISKKGKKVSKNSQ